MSRTVLLPSAVMVTTELWLMLCVDFIGFSVMNAMPVFESTKVPVDLRFRFETTFSCWKLPVVTFLEARDAHTESMLAGFANAEEHKRLSAVVRNVMRKILFIKNLCGFKQSACKRVTFGRKYARMEGQIHLF